ncbi:MAG TPA: hypothetical protein VFB59_04790 [Candidatus Saccharimonadales bacterium]|nr:hypothetical protein [Candidatus Saccharimonadales bacterium]
MQKLVQLQSHKYLQGPLDKGGATLLYHAVASEVLATDSVAR